MQVSLGNKKSFGKRAKSFLFPNDTYIGKISSKKFSFGLPLSHLTWTNNVLSNLKKNFSLHILMQRRFYMYIIVNICKRKRLI